MKEQTSPSSSIIIVLTDGKLEVYPFDLSVQEVRKLRSRPRPVSNPFPTHFRGSWLVVVLPRQRRSGPLEPEFSVWG